MPEDRLTRRAALGTAAIAGTLIAGATSSQAKADEKGGVKLFEKVAAENMKKGAPPIVFYPPPDGHIVFKTQDELKAWEDEVRTRLGVQMKMSLGTASESCSAGCSDDCDQ